MKKNLRKSKNLTESLFKIGVLMLAICFGIAANSQTTPVFSDNPDDITVQCVEDVPEQEVLTATSDCDPVNVTTFTSHTGAPVDSCLLSSANDEWSIWLPALEELGLAPSESWHFQGNATYVSYDDNTANVSGVIVNSSDPSLMMFVEFWLNNGMNWTDWSDLGRSYKDDLNNGTITHVDWRYYEMVAGFSHITGLGSLTGTDLFMSHEPENYYYGFQCGFGANDKNTNMGMSGWFAYTGTYDGVSVEGAGDLNVDKTCIEFNPLACVNHDEITNMWHAVDTCGNMANYTQIISVEDTTAPVFTVFPESNVTVNCQNWPLDVFEGVEAIDNCNSGLLDLVYEGEFLISESPCESHYVRRWIATDVCFNTATFEQFITVIDDEAPVFVGTLDDITIECDEEIPTDMLSATDNCGEPTVDLVETTTGSACETVLTRTFTATDACGLTTVFVQTITILDTTPPVFDDYEIEVYFPCDEAPEAIYVTATDNCGEVTITVEDDYWSGGCAMTMVKTYTATDGCGNSTSVQQIVHLIDDEAPIFVTFPDDVMIECDQDVPTLASGEAEITIDDNCTMATLFYEGSETIAGDCPQNYTITYTWRVIDECANEDFRTWTITVEDTTPPVFSFFPDALELDCSEEIPVTTATAQDNCGIVSVTYEDIVSGDTCEMIITRTFTAIDECGNSTSADQLIVKTDTTAPTLVVADDLFLECDEEIPAPDYSVEDDCSEVNVVVTSTIEDGDCLQAYVMTRTYTATDVCGNETILTQTITVEDTTDPVFTFIPENLTIDCNDALPTINAEASDNCDTNLIVTFTDETTGDTCEMIIVRTFVVTDNCGNSNTATQIITKVDSTAPTLTVGVDMNLECDEDVPEPEYLVEDDCSDVTVEVTSETVAGDCPHAYVLTRTYTATDVCGNSTTMVQIITVDDTTAPLFTFVPADETIDCGDVLPTEMATATDNCGTVSVSFVDETTGDSCEMITVRTFTAVDECNNSSTATQTITMVDSTAPILSIADNVVISCEDEVPAPEHTVSDNCSEVIVDVTETIDGGDYCYVITRTYIATDACGNSTSPMIQIITVEDNEAPQIIETPSNQNYSCPDDVPTYEDCTSIDNCDPNPTSATEWQFISQDGCGNYVAIVTCTASDACGNSSSISFTVTVQDTIAPEFVTELNDLEIDCDDNIPLAENVEATDNCGDVTYSVSDEILGDMPNPDALLDCDATTPATDYYDVDWGMMMYNGGTPMYATIIEANFTEFPDGTAHLVATLVSTDNPDGGYFADVWFMNGMDWANWSTQVFPTGYKDDFGLVGDNYLDWTYYILNDDAATMIGWGDYAGSFLSLSHAPSNYYYGFQIGVGANNVNMNYGGGGWFTYTGSFIDSSTGTNEVISGGGDFAWDGDCCPDYLVERTYCATDCSGNEACFTQVISFADLDGVVGGTPMTNTIVGTIAAEKSFDFVSIAPNPVSESSLIEYRSNIDTELRLEIFDTFGHKLQLVFDEAVKANTTYKKHISVIDMPSGVYMLRLSSDDASTSRRIVVVK